MNFIAVLAALGLEQWHAFHWRPNLEKLFVRYARAVERRLNGGTARHGLIATLVVIAPPVLVVGAIFFALMTVHPVLGLVWNIAVLYLLMGFRRFSYWYSEI